jgi:L-malate glycosyltransferase
MSRNAISILENDDVLIKFKTNAAEQARKFDIHHIVPIYENLYDRFLLKPISAKNSLLKKFD